MKKSLLVTLFVTLGLTFAASSFAQLPAKMLPLAADVVVLGATVDSVDTKKRIVVLKDANGNLAQMNVSKQVNDFSCPHSERQDFLSYFPLNESGTGAHLPHIA